MNNEKNLRNYLGLGSEVYDLSKPNPSEDVYAFYSETIVYECRK